MSPDRKVTVSRGFTLRTVPGKTNNKKKGSAQNKEQPCTVSCLGLCLCLYLTAGCFRPSLCHSLYCLPPGSQGSSRTCSRFHQTHVAEHGRASVRDSPLLSPDRLLFQTGPGGVGVYRILISGSNILS